MGAFLALPAGLLCAVLQSALMPRLRILGVAPGLVLVVLVVWVLLRGAEEGAIFALSAGIVLDMLSSAPFGTGIVGLALVTLMAGLGAANVFRAAWYLPYITIAAATLLYGLVQVVALQAAGRQAPLAAGLGYVVLPELLANLALMAVCYELARVAQHHRRRGEVR